MHHPFASIPFFLTHAGKTYPRINAVGAELVNPRATEEAKRLKRFLDGIYGTKILSGQFDDAYLDYIVEASRGKSPAIVGFDFNGICPSQHGTTAAEKALDWVTRRGGIAQFQWHWISPNADGDFYSKTFDLRAALADTGGASYGNMLRDMDLVAGAIRTLQDAGVPVLWRPLHEAEGKWFWWGNAGGEACIALYRLMYDRFVNHHGLHNLIWIWTSYGETKQNWYPGDDVVDIIAWDYPDHWASNSWRQYQKLFGANGKLFGIGESRALPDPKILSRQPWLYFMTWANMIRDNNASERIYRVYNDPRVITLEDLHL